MKTLITGAAGFIGTNLVKFLLEDGSAGEIIGFDKLTYASNDEYKNLNFKMIVGDIASQVDLAALKDLGITHVIHLAAESHVDRSISNPSDFIFTNIVGTFNLLEFARKQNIQRFLHVSTDEVFGSLLANEPPFAETSNYRPNSPYSASKASSDMLVRSYFKTYGLNCVTTNCSNNFGPYQHGEKFIPTIIRKIAEGEEVPIFGEGNQIRDWLSVKDHCRAILLALQKGEAGETYLVGGSNEITNLELVETISRLINKNARIKHIEDRAGHDIRYSVDSSKIQNDLGWSPREDFETSLLETIKFYNK